MKIKTKKNLVSHLQEIMFINRKILNIKQSFTGRSLLDKYFIKKSKGYCLYCEEI